MDWSEHFEAVFFNAWKNAGLPSHQNYLTEYNDTREKVDFENVYIEQTTDDSTIPAPNQLRSVYGFGALIGKIYSEILDLGEDETLTVRDWCGRFNLGISVFDYLCDETDVGMDSVTSLKVFQPFIKSGAYENFSPSPMEEYLSNLTKGVLQDIKKETFQESATVFNLLKQLFEAQLFLSKTELSNTANLEAIRFALQLKSSGPFEVMAKFASHNESRNKSMLMAALGRSLGDCYWLIDDAKDVWKDLEENQWNLFFYKAALEDSSVFSNNYEDALNDHLSKIWIQAKLAEKLSIKMIDNLVDSIQKLEVSKKVEQQILGLISASLWQWIKY